MKRILQLLLCVLGAFVVQTTYAAKHPHIVKQLAAKHAAWSKTLAPLGKIPEIRDAAPIIPTGHGWAFASGKNKSN